MNLFFKLFVVVLFASIVINLPCFADLDEDCQVRCEANNLVKESGYYLPPDSNKKCKANFKLVEQICCCEEKSDKE